VVAVFFTGLTLPMRTEKSGAAPVSFERLFRTEAPFVWRTLRSFGVDDVDLEDTCQEVFVVVQRRLETFRRDSSQRTWLYGICRRVAADWRKRAHRRREVVTDEVPDPGRAASQLDELGRTERWRRLQRLLEGLDEGKREVFVLYEVEEIPMPEVASMVGVKLQTAYYRLHAARRELREALEREAER
jgi:RNA polymerase sigma-70 factor (ECF subfamily)